MKLAWLHHDPGYVGGAELTMREFKAAAPDDVEFVEPREAETVVIGNCVTMMPVDLVALEGKKVIRYHHDLARHEHPDVWHWLDENADHIYTSPLHQQTYGAVGWPNIPPALKLSRSQSNGSRKGTCSVASWMNPGKGGQLLREFSDRDGGVDVYGSGPFLPHGENLIHKGALEPDEVAETLARYARFVFLPSVVEPFGRCVVEAWASGCEIVTNDLVGARHYIENDPAALATAGHDFWDVVT